MLWFCDSSECALCKQSVNGMREQVINNRSGGGGGRRVLQYRRGGGTSEDLPLQKGGLEKVYAMLKGCAKSFEVVLMQELEVIAILKEGTENVNPLKGGGRKRFYPVLRTGRGRKKFRTCDFPIL